MITRAVTLSALMAIICALPQAGCSRWVCELAPAPNLDSAWHSRGGPLRILPHQQLSVDSVQIVVVDSVRGQSLGSVAGARFLEEGNAIARADTAGRVSLPIPASARSVLEVGALGFMRRRDTLEVAALRGKRVEAPLAYPEGDIEAIPCHRQRRFWPW
jgi:hypothetical protein